MSPTAWGWVAIAAGLLLTAPYILTRRRTALLAAGLPLIVGGSGVVWWQIGAFG